MGFFTEKAKQGLYDRFIPLELNEDNVNVLYRRCLIKENTPKDDIIIEHYLFLKQNGFDKDSSPFYTCEIKTEYYEDAGLAREAYEQLRDGEDAFEELSDWYLLLDDDVTYAVKSDFYDSLQYCKLYDHYVVYIWATDHGDVATEIMYDIEDLIEE